MKQLKEYEKRWIGQRNDYRRECSFFYEIRSTVKKELEKNHTADMRLKLEETMKVAKLRLSDAAKKFEKERAIFLASKDAEENPQGAEIQSENGAEYIIARLEEMIARVRLPEEKKKEIDEARFGKDRDKMLEQGELGVKLLRIAQKTGRKIEEVASNYKGFEDKLEPGLQALVDPDAGRPENVDWMGLSSRQAMRPVIEGGELTEEDQKLLDDPFAVFDSTGVVEGTTSKDEEKSE